MIEVDHALDFYWDVVTKGRPVGEQIGALCRLLRECRRWLAKKKKKAARQGMLPGFMKSETHGNRMLQVQNLATEALAELQRLEPGFFRSQTYYDQRKGTFRPAFYVVPKALQGGYQNERRSYLGHGKTQAYAATNIVGEMDYMHDDAATIPKTFSRGLVQKIQAHGKKALDQLTAEEWEQIGQHTESGNMWQVFYMNKIERLRYLLRPDNHTGLLMDWQDQPANLGQVQNWACYANHPSDSPHAISLYAMDEHGMLFSGQLTDITQLVGGGRYINHSSFLSGDDIICAGSLVIENGRLKLITNNSGHYCPPLRCLRNALRVLNADGVDLTQTTAVALAFEGHQEYVQWYDPQSLIMNDNPAPSYRAAK
jgi:hypothetical protein